MSKMKEYEFQPPLTRLDTSTQHPTEYSAQHSAQLAAESGGGASLEILLEKEIKRVEEKEKTFKKEIEELYNKIDKKEERLANQLQYLYKLKSTLQAILDRKK